jgi:predicted nucleotidyltransferase
MKNIVTARHGEEIARLCRRYHVRRLDIFGSAISGEFDPASFERVQDIASRKNIETE